MIPIHRLVTIADDRASLALGWFETLGRWVVDERDARSQQWFATACHRLAWHAELWSERRPAVPHDIAHPRPRAAEVSRVGDRVAALETHLADERERLADLAARIDPDLDPATIRLISLVDADLADLLRRRP